MYIITGLGNPGAKYDGTRHNVGFSVIDILSDMMNIPLDYEKHKAICGTGMYKGEKVLLAKPITFMNLSGESVSQLCNYYKIDIPENLVVISDDIDLEVGRVRIRKKGSAGGHNGLKNIIQLLGRQDFPRVRLGVGAKPPMWDLADWVLGHFDEEGAKIVGEAEKEAAEAVALLIEEGIDKAMNRYNC
ncbi:MAG: aminoacyl-tRNA hydrolase [Lachnospiraceae bacterium]|nr:aminoacyl-tRNA hydrolase [Lachnospiraceae bacterium]